MIDICTCGHKIDSHWDEDEDGGSCNDGTGRCQAMLNPSGHHCSGCGYDPADYCACQAFKPDNLRYLEQKANETKV